MKDEDKFSKRLSHEKSHFPDYLVSRKTKMKVDPYIIDNVAKIKKPSPDSSLSLNDPKFDINNDQKWNQKASTDFMMPSPEISEICISSLPSSVVGKNENLDDSVYNSSLFRPGPHFQGLSPKEKWKKAIRKVIVLNRFSALNDTTKMNVKLFGREKGHVTVESIKQTPKNSKYVINPDTKLKILWTSLITLCLCFIVIYQPIRLAFVSNNYIEFLIIDISMDLIFFLDIIVNFQLAYYSKDHILVNDNKVIALRYIKGWFFIDLSACVPLYLLFNNSSLTDRNKNELIYNKLLRLLRIGRLYNIKFLGMMKIMKGNKTYEKILLAIKMNSGIKRLIGTMITYFLLLHFFSCLWFYQAKASGFQPDTWVIRYNAIDMSGGEQYFVSFYWVMTLTTVGYGDMMPYTKAERFLSLIYLFVGIAFVSYSIGSLTSVMQSSDTKTELLRKKLFILDELAVLLEIEPSIYYKIKNVIKTNHEGHLFSDISHQALMDDLPASLRTQLMKLIYKKNNFGVVEFFKYKRPDFLNEITPMLKRIKVEKDEIIYRDGHWPDEMYFILKGSVKLVSSDHFIFRTYIQGSYFGEAETINRTNFRNESAVAAEECELLALKKDDLLQLIEHFPEIEEELKNVNEKRETMNDQSLRKARKSNTKIEPVLMKQLMTKRNSIFTSMPSPCIKPRSLSQDNSPCDITRKQQQNFPIISEQTSEAHSSSESSDSDSSDSSVSSVPSQNPEGVTQLPIPIMFQDPSHSLTFNSDENIKSDQKYDYSSSEQDGEEEKKLPDFAPNKCSLKNKGDTEDKVSSTFKKQSSIKYHEDRTEDKRPKRPKLDRGMKDYLSNISKTISDIPINKISKERCIIYSCKDGAHGDNNE